MQIISKIVFHHYNNTVSLCRPMHIPGNFNSQVVIHSKTTKKWYYSSLYKIYINISKMIINMVSYKMSNFESLSNTLPRSLCYAAHSGSMKSGTERELDTEDEIWPFTEFCFEIFFTCISKPAKSKRNIFIKISYVVCTEIIHKV